jgi:hypothetical protein
VKWKGLRAFIALDCLANAYTGMWRELFTRACFLIGLLIGQGHKQGDYTNRPTPYTHLLTAINEPLIEIGCWQTRDGPRRSRAVVLCRLIADHFLFRQSSPGLAFALSASPTWAAAVLWTYD